MVELKKIIIENFRSIRRAEFNVNNQGLTLISGINYDDTLSPNNGAGKTTILYAMCWALYGQTPVGEKGDDILPRADAKNACVSLEFNDGIVISRYRKHKNHENNIIITSNNSPIDVADNKDAQSQIEKFVGFDYDIFCLLLTTGSLSKNSKPIMLMGDTELKEFTDRLLNLTFLQKASDIVKKNLSEKEKQLNDINNKIETTKSNIGIIEGQINNALEEKERYEIYRKSEIAKYKTIIADIEQKIAANRSNIEAQNVLLAEIKPIPADDTEYKKLQELESQHQIQQYSINGEHHALTKKKNEIYSLIAAQTLSSEERQNALANVDRSELTRIEQAQRAYNNEYYEATTKFDMASKIVPAITEAEAKQLAEMHESMKMIKYNIDTLHKEIETLTAEKNGYDGKEDTECPTCLQKVTSKHINKIKKAYDEKIAGRTKVRLELVNEFKTQKDKYIKLSEQYQEAAKIRHEDEMNDIRLMIADRQRNVDSATKELTAIKEKYDDSCEKAISEAIKTKSLEYKRQIEEIDENIRKKDLQLKEIFDIISSVREQMKQETIRLNEAVTLYQTKIREESEIKSQISKLSSEIPQLEGQIKFYDDSIKRFETESSPAEVNLNKLITQKNTLVDAQKAYNIDIMNINDEIRYLKFWEIGFSGKGIKSFILDSVKSLLDLKGNYCLAKISNDLYLRFETQDTLKNGEIRDKFTINIRKHGINETFQFMQLSKGERARVSFAVAYAMKFLAEYYNNIKLNFDFYDEALDGLDYAGCEHVINFLREELERFSSIFIITHNAELKRLCDKSVIVVKSGGVSEIKNE